jgi:acetylornithine deacetylase
MEGGTASNIVPVSCTFGWEVRALPGFDPLPLERRLTDFAARTCLPQMRKVAPEAAIRISRGVSVPAFAAGEASEAVTLAMRLAGVNTTLAVSYATEAGLFQDAGAASVVCGPGDIAQAHTANEWIAAAELERCDAFLRRLMDWAEA